MSEAEAESKRQKAVQFLERVGGDADKFRQMDAEQYAAHKGFELLASRNPPKRNRRTTMANGLSKAEMNDTLLEVADILDDALDPELSREEVIAKVKEAAALAGDEGGDEETSEDGDEEDLD